jgi:uncharacterized protein YecE (DUF72 family)
VNVRVGTSGYSYAPWKGSFYPADLKTADMLRYYAERFATVEINNTFYRMPNAGMLERWAAETPESFSFVLKASRRLTHQSRLDDADGTAYFFRTAEALGSRLGPVLFQLPPYFRKDVGVLRDSLALVPEGRRVAFEFRHASWFDEEVQDALRAKGAALCLADTDEATDPALVTTTDWGYLRLRRADYDEPALAAWAERIRAQPWKEAWVFFKHEEEGKGPALAARLVAQLGGA